MLPRGKRSIAAATSVQRGTSNRSIAHRRYFLAVNYFLDEFAPRLLCQCDVSRAIPREEEEETRYTCNTDLLIKSSQSSPLGASYLKFPSSLCVCHWFAYSRNSRRLNFIDILGSSWENFITGNCANCTLQYETLCRQSHFGDAEWQDELFSQTGGSTSEVSETRTARLSVILLKPRCSLLAFVIHVTDRD